MESEREDEYKIFAVKTISFISKDANSGHG